MAWMSRITACFLVGAAIGGISLGLAGRQDRTRPRHGRLHVDLFDLYGRVLFRRHSLANGGVRVAAALGMGGEWSLAVALVMECWPERHRSKLAGIIGAACNVGFLFIALVALMRQVTMQDWRWLMLVGASPAVLALLIIFFVPESERWKAAAKKGGRSPILEIFRPGLRSRTLLAMVFSGIPLIGTWAAVSAYIPAWVDDMNQSQTAKGLLGRKRSDELGEVRRTADESGLS